MLMIACLISPLQAQYVVSNNSKGLHKFKSSNGKNSLEVQYKGEIKISDDAVDLLQKLLQSDPRRRLSLQEALAHPWVVPEQETASESSLLRDPQASKCVKFHPCSERTDLNYRMLCFTEESLCRLSLGRMSSF